MTTFAGLAHVHMHAPGGKRRATTRRGGAPTAAPQRSTPVGRCSSALSNAARFVGQLLVFIVICQLHARVRASARAMDASSPCVSCDVSYVIDVND